MNGILFFPPLLPEEYTDGRINWRDYFNDHWMGKVMVSWIILVLFQLSPSLVVASEVSSSLICGYLSESVIFTFYYFSIIPWRVSGFVFFAGDHIVNGYYLFLARRQQESSILWMPSQPLLLLLHLGGNFKRHNAPVCRRRAQEM